MRISNEKKAKKPTIARQINASTHCQYAFHAAVPRRRGIDTIVGSEVARGVSSWKGGAVKCATGPETAAMVYCNCTHSRL